MTYSKKPLPHRNIITPPTLSAIKCRLVPIFDRIFTGRGVASEIVQIDSVIYIQVYGVCYDYLAGCSPRGLTSISQDIITQRPLTEEELDNRAKIGSRGYDFYEFVEEYFKQKANEIMLSTNIPVTHFETIKVILQEFKRYQACSRLISRMLGYMDRCYIDAVTQDGAGWLRESDLDGEVSLTRGTVFFNSRAYKQKERAILAKWGFSEYVREGIPKEDALASAQASTSINRIIPTLPLAMRRFRTEVLEPLVFSSDGMKEWIRLNLLLTTFDVTHEGYRLVADFKDMSRRVGISEFPLN